MPSQCRIKCLFPHRVPREGLACLPLAVYKEKLVLIESDADAFKAIPEILNEKILGFDTESRPSFKSSQHYPVSIIQLCGKNCVWIFKLSNMDKSIPSMFSILENPSIKKVGVAVKGDISALCKLYKFTPEGFEDISEKTRKIGILNTGLRNLAAVFLGWRISKSSQMSNWAAETLTKKQLTYAATDAWISRELYLVVNKIYKENRYMLALGECDVQKKQEGKRGIISKFFQMLRS